MACTEVGAAREFTVRLFLELLQAADETALEVSRFPSGQGDQTLWNLNPTRTGLEVRALGPLVPNKIKGVIKSRASKWSV